MKYSKILLCFGALIGILIMLFAGTLAGFILALPLFVCGTICLTVRHRTGLWCAWVMYLMVELYLRYATGLSWTTIFFTFRWTAEMNYMRLAIAWGQALYLLVMLLCTLRSYRMLILSGSRKQLEWLEPMYYAAHHVLDLIRTGLFAVLLVLTAALWRGWRQSRSKTK